MSKPKLLKCAACDKYTLQESCPTCGKPTQRAAPPKFSPQDKYGPYRRKQLYGNQDG